MKLSLAASLLGLTVPVLSRRHGPALVKASDGAFRLNSKILRAAFLQSIFEHDDEHVNRQVTRNLRNVPRGRKPMVPCDPRSTDADIGILSCGEDHICKPSMTSSLGGVCTTLESEHRDHGHPRQLGRDSILPRKGVMVKHHPLVTTSRSKVVQCDPTLIDIGILVCEEGQFCEHDATSALGGFCVDSSIYSNRRLEAYYLEDMLYNCEPWPAEDPFGICDCSTVNMTTGTGTMYCSQNETASWVTGCDEYVVYDTFSYSFTNSILVRVQDCYESKTPFMEKLCFFYRWENTEPLCYAELNGKNCTSCEVTNYYPAFDCSNVEEDRVGDSRRDFMSVFDLCANSTCTNFCGEGSYIPDINFDISVNVTNYARTCGILAFLDEHVVLDNSYCPYYIEAAQRYCCVPVNSNITDSEGDSPIPGADPEDNFVPPVETDDKEEPSAVLGTETDNDSDSGGQRIVSIASMACQAAAIMTLVARP